MFAELQGKKVLLLGAIQRACAIVRRAQERGMRVVVADPYPDSPAKAVADEAVLIDATDVEALTRYAIDNGVDGVTTAYVDPLLGPCREISERIGRPFYATELMIELATDKVAFKEYCERFGVPVPKTYDVPAEGYIDAAETLAYPVFIKPIDASGSRGADVCRSPEEFRMKYERALGFSKRKEITVEDYLQGTEFILDYAIVDGEPRMLSMADRFTSAGRPAGINHPNLMLLPSFNLERYYEEVHPRVCRMFKELGFSDGIVFFQGYASEERIAFYEMGCRLGGTWPYIDEAFTGINPMDMLLLHAVTGRMLPEGADANRITPFFEGAAAVVYFVSTRSSGHIARITGLEEVKSMPEVVCILQYRWEGDDFEMGSQTDVLLLAVHLAAADAESLEVAVEEVYSKIDYLDGEGESLLSEPVRLRDALDMPALHLSRKEVR